VSKLILSQLVVENEPHGHAEHFAKLLVSTNFVKLESVARVSSGHGAASR
jgi:hypothetical protein